MLFLSLSLLRCATPSQRCKRSHGAFYEGEGWHKLKVFTVTPFGRLMVVQGAVPGRFQSKKSDLLLVEIAKEKTEREFRLL